MTRENFISRHPIEQVCAERGIKLIGGGNERMACCPFHRDRKPSFCVTVSKQLWTCYAGCGGGSVIDLLCKLDNISPHDFCVKHEIGNGESRGFFRRAVEKLKPKTKPEVKSLFTPRTRIKPQEEEADDPNIEKIYSYQDVFGLEVYQVVRYKPKDFRQRHREDDRWVWSMQNVERVLYHLPEVNQSPTVIVTEGERDCDSLVELGFVATTNVGGAGKWLDSYSEHLEGKEVIICGDNDEPGQKHVRQVFDSVADRAKVVKILHLPKSVKDVSDYIATFKTPQEAKNSLEAIVGAAPPLIKGKELPIYGVWELEKNYARHATMLADYSLDLSKMVPSWKGQVRPLVPGEVMTLVGDTGSCKCLAPGTKVIKFDGTTDVVENIAVGDKLMGPDSKPRTVLSTGSGSETMYRVQQNNGDDYECNESHILSLQQTHAPQRGMDGGKIVDVPIRYYLERGQIFKHLHKGYKVGVEFPSKIVPVDPYFLGLWLGDGTSQSPSITTGDSEIKQYLINFANKNNLTLRFEQGCGCETIYLVRLKKWGLRCTEPECRKKHCAGGYCKDHYMYYRNRDGYSAQDTCGLNLIKIFRKLNLFGNKHIPYRFMVNSRKNRLKLLAGLIDSDGTNGRNGVIFGNTNERLARDVTWLARSLGFKTSITERISEIKSIGYKCKSWMVFIRGKVSDIPILLKRKIGRDSTKYKSLRYGIKVKKLGFGKYHGFTIDGDGRFLLGDFTVTHNTALTQAIFISAIPMPTVLFELELPDDLMFERFVAMRRQMLCIDVERQYIEGRQIGEAVLREEFDNLYVCTKSRLTIEQIDDYICRSELKIGERPKVVGIDYVQLAKGRGDSRRERIAQIAEDIKVLAKERNVIVIVTSQVARPREGEKTIGLHSAKEAGEIESSSGFMLGFWRDEKDWQIIHSKILKMTKGRSGLETDFNFDGARMMITERPKIDPADIPPPPQVRERPRRTTKAREYPDD